MMAQLRPRCVDWRKVTPLKILIADDEPGSRDVISSFLEADEHDVVIAEDGATALRVMLGPEPPAIVVLDWMMPGLSGMQVCTRLRAAGLKIRPYVMMVSGKAQKAEIIASLDAGADDYLTKPYNGGELLARVRVAGRAVQAQIEHLQQIDELEALARRYNLLGEIASQPGHGPATPAIAVGAPAVAVATLGLLTRDSIVETMSRALVGLGLGRPTVRTAARLGDRPADFSAWAGLLLTQEKVWLDLLLEIDAASADALYALIFCRKADGIDCILGYLAETHTIFRGAFKATLQAPEGEIFMPLMSRALHTEHLSEPLPIAGATEVHTFALAGCSLALTVACHSSPVRLKTAGQLHASDTLAEAFPPPEVSGVPMLNKGVRLKERFIDKLVDFVPSQLHTLLVPVYEPSALAAFFMARE
jgi:CheY-like chemotaxis protein